MDIKIGVIGYGRFGKLLANSIIPGYVTVYVYENGEVNPEARVPSNVFSVNSYEELCKKSDWIFVCVPMRDFEVAITNVQHFVDNTKVVFDVCSLKKYPTDIMKLYLEDTGCQIIPTHPLFGPQSFVGKGLKWAICNVSGSEEVISEFELLLKWREIAVKHCSPESHDFQMASSQALTHFIGRTAERMGLSRMGLSTQSFDDLMDIVELVKGGSKELFEDMQKFNPYSHEIRSKFMNAAHSLDYEIRYGKEEE